MTTRTSSNNDFDFTVPDSEDVLLETDAIEDLVNHPRVSAADLLKASLLVTSLSSGISTASKNKDYFDGEINDNLDDNETAAAARNYSRSVWLAEVSFKDGEMDYDYDKKLGDW